MIEGTGSCVLKAAWAMNPMFNAASVTVHTAAKRITPTVSLAGDPRASHEWIKFYGHGYVGRVGSLCQRSDNHDGQHSHATLDRLQIAARGAIRPR